MSNLLLAKTHKEFKIWNDHFLIDWHYAQTTVLDSFALKTATFYIYLEFWFVQDYHFVTMTKKENRMIAKPLNKFIVGIITFILFVLFSCALVMDFLQPDHGVVFAGIPDSKSILIPAIITLLLLK